MVVNGLKLIRINRLDASSLYIGIEKIGTIWMNENQVNMSNLK